MTFLKISKTKKSPQSSQNLTILKKSMSCYHPPSIKKSIPLAVQKMLALFSSNKRIFDNASKQYQEALGKDGYSHTLTYDENNNPTTKYKRNRQRKTT